MRLVRHTLPRWRHAQIVQKNLFSPVGSLLAAGDPLIDQQLPAAQPVDKRLTRRRRPVRGCRRAGEPARRGQGLGGGRVPSCDTRVYGCVASRDAGRAAHTAALAACTNCHKKAHVAVCGMLATRNPPIWPATSHRQACRRRARRRQTPKTRTCGDEPRKGGRR